MRRSDLKALALANLLVLAGCGGAELPEVDELSDAYVYLLSRALVLRQEQVDLSEEGIDYNVIKYNPVGSADFVNPNLDVAYLEAWIAVDDETPVILEIPEIVGRYYTAQVLDEWGEVIVNINERNYPSHPFGKFALIAPGSNLAVPSDAVVVALHSYKAKLLARVELKDDPQGAIDLQRRFTLNPLGSPSIDAPVTVPSFDNRSLLGVEIFDDVEAMLTSAPDVSPIATQMQTTVREIAASVREPEVRAVVDSLIDAHVVPQFLEYAVSESAVFRNNWLGSIGTGEYGSDFWLRSSANLVGIWANTNAEVVYFVATRDAAGEPLNGANRYTLEFPAGERPDSVVEGYWSVILVDLPDYRVVPNPIDRFNLNTYSGLRSEPDGSLRILIAPEPDPDMPQENWLPAPDGRPFSLTLRTYVPRGVVQDGEWFPPAIRREG